jgi:hypothetical protein
MILSDARGDGLGSWSRSGVRHGGIRTRWSPMYQRCIYTPVPGEGTKPCGYFPRVCLASPRGLATGWTLDDILVLGNAACVDFRRFGLESYPKKKYCDFVPGPGIRARAVRHRTQAMK